MSTTVPACLSIAGSDPSGGAGIQADLKTFAAHGVYGMSVITAVTVQNTLGVSAVHSLPAELVGQQLRSVLSDIPPAAIKIGMLDNANIITQISAGLDSQQYIVLDPVLVSSSGRMLLQSDAIEVLIDQLLPKVTLLTPNLDEARVLADVLGIGRLHIESQQELQQAAVTIAEGLQQRIGHSPSILVKGGHLQGDPVDALLINGEFHFLHGERIDNPNTHGTGCTLSSAICANLAVGQSMLNACENAKSYVAQAINKQLKLGQGIGPLQHNISSIK